jgi:HAE1 family hydrophobic/amphiphilic exporter-1
MDPPPLGNKEGGLSMLGLRMRKPEEIKKFFLILFLTFSLLGIVGPGILWGQEQKVLPLTLEECRRIVLEKNKDIQKAKEYRNSVMGRYIEERAAALPQLTANAAINHERDESLKGFYRGLFPFEREARTADVGLSQALYTFGRIGAAIRAAKIGLETAEDQLRIFRQAALRDVSAAFQDVLLAKELNVLARQNLDQKARHQDETRRKFSAGVATEYDVLAAEVGVENARPDVIRTENLIRTSREKLRFILGTEDQEVDGVGELTTSLEPNPNYEETLKVARKNRPELSDLQKKVQIYEELVKIYDAGNLPRIDLKAGWGWRQLSFDTLNFGSAAGEGQAWSAGVFFSFPFFDGMRTQGKVIQAKTDVANLKIDEAKLRDSIALQVRDAISACREAEEIVRALSGTVRQAERLLRMAEKGFEYGIKTRLEVDDAQLNVNQAKGNLAKAYRDYLVARATLEWVTGTIGEKKSV